MKKRQIESGKAFGKGGKGYDQMINTFDEKTSTRKELAKLANTSEGFDIVSSNRTAQICVF